MVHSEQRRSWGPADGPAGRRDPTTAAAWYWTCGAWALGVASGLLLFLTRLLPPPTWLVVAVHLVNIGTGLLAARRTLDAVRAGVRKPSAVAAFSLAAAAVAYWIWSMTTGGPMLLL